MLADPHIQDIETPGVDIHKTWKIITTSKAQACLYTLSAYALGVVVMSDLYDYDAAFLGFIPALIVLVSTLPKSSIVDHLPDADTLSTTRGALIIHAFAMFSVGLTMTHLVMSGPAGYAYASLLGSAVVAYQCRPTPQGKNPKHLLESATYPQGHQDD